MAAWNFKDLTGQRFGMLTVVSRHGEFNKPVKWNCVCDCGNTCVVSRNELMNGGTGSCGYHRYIDEAGKVYGKLTVIKRGDDYVLTRRNGKKVIAARWICQCECGNITLVSGKDLRNGKTKSCGGCFLPRGESAFNSFYDHVAKSARTRNMEWSLDKETVRNISSQECFYCGRKPSQVTKTQSDTGVYVHNGIDRIDSSIGYVVGNVVPCCKHCNYAKRVMSVGQFKNWIISVYEHFAKL